MVEKKHEKPLNPEEGRKELLERHMFHLRRFDSAEYELAGLEGGKDEIGGREKYAHELEATEEYEKKHHLSHDHFVHHHSPPNVQIGPGQHPLQAQHPGEMNLDPASKGSQELVNRNLFHLKRFDSAEYVLSRDRKGYHEELIATESYERKHRLSHEHFENHHLKSRNQICATSPHYLEAANKPFDNDANRGNETRATFSYGESSNKKNDKLSVNSASRTVQQPNRNIAKQFLRRRIARKRWDSGDYNVLLTSPGRTTFLEDESTPDLDMMSVSSSDQTDGEFKFEENSTTLAFDSADNFRPPSTDTQERVLAFAKENSKMTATPPALPPPPPFPSSGKRMSTAAAKQHFFHHQSRAKRFDSADYFLGIGLPAQECEVAEEPSDSSFPVLGESTLALRELRAQKVRQEKGK